MSANSTIILAVFFFLIGAAVIGLIWYLQYIASGSYRRAKRTRADRNLVEVASLMRDKTNQDLVVAINGDTFKVATELNPGQLRRLHFASKVLVKWLADTPPEPLDEEKPAEASTADSAATDHAQAEPAKLAEDWIPAETAPMEEKEGYIPPFVVTDAQTDVKPVSTQIPDVVSGILNPAPPPAPVPEFKSIAMQIDEILQTMIASTPFAARGISVSDAPDHGVLVTLDGKDYTGVKDVPDEEVRSLIRSAVVEWEKTSKFSPHG